MEAATAIVKGLILPYLEKENSRMLDRVDLDFWNKFRDYFLNFETDPKPVYAAIYSLNLDDPERLINKLQKIYISFIGELAEQYVLGNPSEVIHTLGEVQNSIFDKKVQFFHDMKAAITALERKRLIDNAPRSYELLTTPLSDNTIEAAIKKKSREDLRSKFELWDLEMEKETREVIQFDNNSYYVTPPESSEQDLDEKKNEKIISLIWIKYAAAACVLFAAGLFFFNSGNNFLLPGKEVVNTDVEKNSEFKKENIQLADIEKCSLRLNVLKRYGLGYSDASDKKLIEINFIDANARISSLREILDEKNGEYLSDYRQEMSLLQNRQGKYSFDGNQLAIYSGPFKEDFHIIELEENQFYLLRGDMFYKLTVSETPQELKKESENTTIEELEKIIFINE